MELNTIKPAAGRQARRAAPRRPRHRLGPGQDRGPRPQGPEVARRRLPQGRLRGRPDAAAAPPAEARLRLAHAQRHGRSAPVAICRSMAADATSTCRAEGGGRGAGAALSGEGHPGRQARAQGQAEGHARRPRARRRRSKRRAATSKRPRAAPAPLKKLGGQAGREQQEKRVGDCQSPREGRTASYGDLKRRLLFLLGALVVYRIGAHIPVPGIDPNVLAELFKSQQGGILGHVQHVLGRRAVALHDLRARHHAVHLGLDHHAADDGGRRRTLEALKKEGEAGRRKITQYTRYGTRGARARSRRWASRSRSSRSAGLVLEPGLAFRLTTVITLVTGTMFLMWLGEQITERGLGNGISIIIFAGIAAGLPQRDRPARSSWCAPARCSDPAVLVHRRAGGRRHRASSCSSSAAQRKILVNYAKRQVGNKVYGGQSSHLPLKLNMSGVIPPIFASSIILFPATLARLVRHRRGHDLAARHRRRRSRPGQPST